MTALIQELELTLGTRLGDYAEFGVYNATSMICMYRALAAAQVVDTHMVGFDSFKGLPSDAPNDDGGVWSAGQFACSYEVATANLVASGVPADKYTLVPGWYRDTLAIPSSTYFTQPVSIVFIDCDTYQSARNALAFIGPQLSSTSCIVFDDWRLHDLDLKGMGECKAFAEFLDQNTNFSWKAKRAYNRKSQAFILTRHG
jgi:hypothetical protein